VSALVLDAGAFVAAERDDRVLIARLRAAQRHGGTAWSFAATRSS
jgi:hypothetical protein